MRRRGKEKKKRRGEEKRKRDKKSEMGSRPLRKELKNSNKKFAKKQIERLVK